MKNKGQNSDSINSITFSMAVSHSGHTLLSFLLDSHPELTHLGDTISSEDHFKQFSCACGVMYEYCNFWTKLYNWEKFDFLRTGFPRNRLIKIIFYFLIFLSIQK